ncbi:MAG: phosphoglucomutase/phosphomannomutase family protein [Candidatus Omnitrophota bacterium]|jgi:phosphomannomutase|nr:MAG: phosphoglucomutase/phosphomannomutase family protein [Candidatus Omnitrophota bacterium]
MSGVKREIKFGTDGWRGVIGDNFTFKNVGRVAKAVADYYNLKAREHSKACVRIAVGYDTRFLSEKFARIVSEVLVREGISVIVSNRSIPTPTLSFAVEKRKLTAGIMITASHNPCEYNGIKIKTASGGAAGIEVTSEVEKLVERPKKAGWIGKNAKIEEADFVKDYIRFLKGYIDFERLRNMKFRVLVDAMHGSGNSFIAEILKGSRIKVEFIRSDINPSFGGLRPEPVLENLAPTVARLKKDRFDLCLVLDGDADRIAAFAGNGEFIYPQKILGLLTLHLRQDRKMSGGVVKTIVGTNMIDAIAKKLGLPLYETPVGFKYISELMVKKEILVGGEEAGGMGFKGYIPERDGSLAGLLLLEMMAYRKKNMLAILREMEKEFGRYYYWRDDLKLKQSKVNVRNFKKIKRILGQDVVLVKDYDGVKLIRQDTSWLMLRASGTEPIVRVYAESKSQATSRRLVEFGSRLIKNVL